MPWKERREELGKKVSKALFESGAIKFGEFTLTSGRQSSYYVDLRVVPSFPEQFDIVTDAYRELITNEVGNKCTLVGVPSAGVPIASVTGYKAKLPAVYIRKEALKDMERDHGTGNEIEGLIRKEMPPILVDDLISTGKSNLASNRVMKRNGHNISKAVLLIDREMGGPEALKKEGIDVICLLKMSEVVKHLEDEGLLERGLADHVRAEIGD